MTHLYLIRHADYIYGEHDGRNRDLGLSPEGHAQAERLRERLARTREIRPDVFISSTERRAQAERLGERLARTREIRPDVFISNTERGG